MDRRLALILALLLAGGIVLTVAAFVFGIFPFDLQVARWVRGFDHPVFIAAVGAVSFFGNGWVPIVLVFGMAAFCAVREKWLEAVFVILTLSAFPLDGVLKVLVGRPRPPGAGILISNVLLPFNSYAYPSGHVLFYIVFFGFLAYLSWKFLPGRLRWISVSACIALIILIGPSRIFLGEHWVSDVIGSYIIGTFWLIVLILLYQGVLRSRTRRSFPTTG
jgi:membrane-associated phospholipid phosphatase